MTNTKKSEDRSSIACSKTTIRELKKLGICGESVEDIIKRLMFKKKHGRDQDTEFEKKIEGLI